MQSPHFTFFIFRR